MEICQQTARLNATSVRLKKLKLTSFCLISCPRAPLAFSYLQILKFNCHGYFGFYLYTENVLYSEKAWTCIQNDITQQRRSPDGYVTTSWPGRSCVIPFWTHAKCPLFFITYLPTWLHAIHTICKIVGSTLSYAMQCYVLNDNRVVSFGSWIKIHLWAFWHLIQELYMVNQLLKKFWSMNNA